MVDTTVNFFFLQRIDEDKLFNLFSIYGNIVRIKLLRNKPDHALVQMGDGFQAELAVHFLKVWCYYISLSCTGVYFLSTNEVLFYILTKRIMTMFKLLYS